LRGLGFTYREIGHHYGVTPQAVSLMLNQNRRKLQSIGGQPRLASLSTRAATALCRLGVNSPAEASQANILAKLSCMSNCGRKTREVIETPVTGLDLTATIAAAAGVLSGLRAMISPLYFHCFPGCVGL
jgi:hypothetical protein